MQEVIRYFESIEARLAEQEQRLAAQDERLAALEAELTELKNRPAPEPQVVEKVVEKVVEVEKPVEVIKEVVVEKPVVVPVEEPTSRDLEASKEEPIVTEPEPEPIKEEPAKELASPNAALYGKAVTDIRQAISLGDRFLYQRELFGQNAELMQRTLTELDALSSFDEAVNYISRFGWDQESPTYQQFLVTLHRRFG